MTLSRLPFLGSFLGVIFVIFSNNGWADHVPLPFSTRSAEEWVRLFQVPSANDPWLINSRIKDYRVKLEFPRDLPKVQYLPPEVRDIVRQRIKFRAKNLEILRDSILQICSLCSKTRLALMPEYQQSLGHVVLSVFPEKSGTNPLWRHEPVLRALPEYTKIDLFVPDSLMKDVQTRLLQMGMSQRVKIHKVVMWGDVESGEQIIHSTTRWARDLMEIVTDNHGHNYAIIPAAHSQTEDLTRPDNDYLGSLAMSNTRIIKVPLFFHSGNIITGVIGNRRILFIGSQELEDMDSYFYNAFFYIAPKQAVRELLQIIFGADELVVLPNSEHLFHIDMSMTFLGDGVAAVLDLVDTDNIAPEDLLTIRVIRTRLKELGFRLVKVPTTPERIALFQSPVNIVTFRHEGDGKIHALVPVFPDKQVMVGGVRHILSTPPSISSRNAGAEQTPMGEWRWLNSLVNDAYQKAGILIDPVEDRFYPVHGNTHCVVMGMK